MTFLLAFVRSVFCGLLPSVLTVGAFERPVVKIGRVDTGTYCN